MGDDLTPDPDERAGIGRRTMIKRAAAAGVVAWTAPVILDSLSSPAAAASCASCYKFEFKGVGSNDTVATTTQVYRSYADGTFANKGNFISRVGNNAPNTQSNSNSDFTVAGESKCTNSIASTTVANVGLTLTGTFDLAQRGAPIGKADLKQDKGTYGKVGSFAGCSGPLQLQGAAIVFRDNSSPLNYWAQSASPTDTLPTQLTPATTSPTQTGFPGLIQSISTTSVTFIMPGSSGDSSTGNSWSTNKPGTSGAFMFVIGCNCG